MRSAWSNAAPQQTAWVGWCATCVLGHLHTSFDGTSFEVELKTALEMCALAADPDVDWVNVAPPRRATPSESEAP